MQSFTLWFSSWANRKPTVALANTQDFSWRRSEKKASVNQGILGNSFIWVCLVYRSSPWKLLIYKISLALQWALWWAHQKGPTKLQAFLVLRCIVAPPLIRRIYLPCFSVFLCCYRSWQAAFLASLEQLVYARKMCERDVLYRYAVGHASLAYICFAEVGEDSVVCLGFKSSRG